MLYYILEEDYQVLQPATLNCAPFCDYDVPNDKRNKAQSKPKMHNLSHHEE